MQNKASNQKTDIDPDSNIVFDSTLKKAEDFNKMFEQDLK